MKYRLSLIFIFVFLSITPNFAQSSTSKTISDVELSEEYDLIISATFAERRVTGKVVGDHDGETATVLDKINSSINFVSTALMHPS
jgi:hypothetical protein